MLDIETQQGQIYDIFHIGQKKRVCGHTICKI